MTAAALYQLRIRTPEGVTFSLPLAGPFVRFLAWLIDLGCLVAIVYALNTLASALFIVGPDLAMAIVTILFFAASVGYGILLEWAWRGQTVGKRVLGLRVMDQGGLHLRFSQIALRNILRLVDSPPFLYPGVYFLGGISCLLSRRAQRLGDLAAGTVVVRYPKLSEPALDSLQAGRFNSLQSYPVEAARLRQAVTPAEAALLIQALEQRSRLDPQARLELFEELATHFRAKVAFPQEATDGVSDEHFLQNVVWTVYRLKAS